MNFGFRNMGKSIIIAEKPSVGMEYAKVLGVTSNGKTNGYLENDKWIVTWTVGHLVTMSYPEKYDPALKEWKLDTLPFLPDQYKYEIIKETSKQFAIVKQLYNRPDIDSIYYAGDSGREGLYIQMLVRQFAGHAPQASEKVVWIDSQTEDEILRGISEAKDLSQYEAMKDSGYMRAIEDYAVGINFSRLLSVRYAIMLNSGSGQKKYKPISVGRVMTCVLGKTGPYYDFISQKGKPFAAYLKWNNDSKKLEFELTDMPWNKTDLKCPICGKSILERDGFYRCEDYIDADHGCKFRIGKIKGKAIPIKQIEKLIKENSTDVIKGFKKEDGGKFDAFLIWDRENERVRFRFPEFEDMITNYHCPICNGKILATSYGYRCENYKAQEKRRETDCSFVLGNIMGHTIKEKELQTILNGGVTEPVSLKNKDKKSFEARLYWDNTQKKIALKFDDNVPVDVAANCPICGNRLKKNKFGYFCSKYSKNPGGCSFYVGTIAGISLDDKQVIKLVTEGKTDLIDGFKPKEKGKRPFSAYLKWDNADKKLQFEFPNADEMKEVSNYNCPVCKVHKLLKSKYGYQCECGFRFGNKIAEREIPDDQIKKLFVVGETDFISGFYSSRTRRVFTAKLVLNGNKIDFVLPEKVLEESDIKCPKCSACMKKGNVFFECECGYKIPHLIAAKHLTDEEVRQLMRGKTGLIKGFKSKTGKRFDAVLIADENGTVKFDFQNK